MTTTRAPHYRLTLSVAKRLQELHGAYSPAFRHLVGQVGTLSEVPHSRYKYGRCTHYLKLRGGFRIAVLMSEVEEIIE